MKLFIQHSKSKFGKEQINSSLHRQSAYDDQINIADSNDGICLGFGDISFIWLHASDGKFSIKTTSRDLSKLSYHLEFLMALQAKLVDGKLKPVFVSKLLVELGYNEVSYK